MLQNITLEKKETKVYPALPEDIYQVELIDISEVEGKKYKSEELEKKLKFEFAVVEDGEFYGYRVWKRLPLTAPNNDEQYENNLHKIVKAIKGRSLTFDECVTFGTDELNELFNKQLRVTTKNTEKDGKIFTNIEAYLPVKSNLPAFSQDKSNENRKKVEQKNNIDTAKAVFDAGEPDPIYAQVSEELDKF